jgi:uncharacterized membrane protein YbhN (UPF0104 family)
MSESAGSSGSQRLRAWVQRGLPAVVSLGALAWLLSTFDLRSLVAALDARVARVMLPALVLYGAATLVIEALSIRRLLEAPPPSFTIWMAARLKCASYLLAVINYTLGGAGLAVLLRQRTGLSLGESAGVVLLIALTDLGLTLTFGALGIVFAQAGVSVMLVGGLAVIAAGIVFGVVIVRVPGSLGPIERIRSLAVFTTLRRTPLAQLLELILLRCLFSACFISIAGAAFVAFDVEIGISRLIGGMMALAIVGALPIAVSGLGTGQVAAVYLFGDLAPAETILAMSLVLSFGLLALRTLMGIVFAREFARHALSAAQEAA